MKNIKKNQIIIYVIALMLVVAGYLNYTSTNDLNSAILTSSTEEELLEVSNIGDAQLVSSNAINEEEFEKNDDVNYFSSSRLERDTMYSQMLETYEKILNNDNSLETQRQSASEEITKINKLKNSIMICENLIKIKGINDVVIFVNEESVNVIVEDGDLSQEHIAQIQNIISREMNANVENIHISSK